MKFKLFKWMPILLLLVYSSCEKDLEYDLPGATPRLVLNSLFSQDSTFRVEISLSATPGEGYKIKSLRDAKLTLFEGTTLLTDFVVDSFIAVSGQYNGLTNTSSTPTKFYFQRSESSRAKSGMKYTIQAGYPGHKRVSASTTLPKPVRIKRLDENNDAAILVDGQILNRISFEVDDNGLGSNYYGIEVLAFKPGRDLNFIRIPFFSGEKAFSENLTVSTGQRSDGVFYKPENGVYFSNGKFFGQKKRFNIYIDNSYMSTDYSVQLRILTLSDEYFKFVTSYQQQKATMNNPFAEPTQVYSNIENGLGIFAAHSVSTLDIN